MCDQLPDEHARQDKELERDATVEADSTKPHPALMQADLRANRCCMAADLPQEGACATRPGSPIAKYFQFLRLYSRSNRGFRLTCMRDAVDSGRQRMSAIREPHQCPAARTREFGSDTVEILFAGTDFSEFGEWAFGCIGCWQPARPLLFGCSAQRQEGSRAQPIVAPRVIR